MNITFRALEPVYDGGWILLHIPGLNHCSDTKGVVAVDLDTNRTVGAVIFDTWTPNSVHGHIIIEEPMLLRHCFLQECFNYAFVTSDRKIMFASVRGDNTPALKLNKKMGFSEIFRVKNGYDDGVDIVMMQIDRDNCRFIDKAKEVA